MTPPVVKRRLKRTAKWLNWTLLLPAAGFTALLVVLLYTNVGLRFNLWLAQHFVSGFSVERSEGSVLGGNTLYQLSWQSSDITLTVERSQLQLDNSCFLRATLCVQQLSLERMQLNIAASDSAADTTSASEVFWLPMAIDIKQLQLTDSTVQFGNNRLDWQQFSTGATLWGNKVQLNQPHWQQVILTLAQTPAQASATEAFSYQAPQLRDITLPVSLFIDRFRLTDFTVQQEQPLQIDELAFSLHMLPTQINLTQLDVISTQANINASAQLQTNGAYPVTATIELLLKTPELAGQRLRIAVDGDLSALQINAYASEQLNAEVSLWLNLLDNTLPISARLQADKLQWPLTDDAEFALQQLDTSVNGQLNELRFASQFQLSGAMLPVAAVQLKGNSTLHSLTLQHLNIATLGGELNAQANLDWQQRLTARGSLQLQQINPGEFWPDYPAQLTGDLQFNAAKTLQGGWRLAVEQLQLNGQLRQYALALTGSIDAQDPDGKGDIQIHSPGLILSHGQNQARLSGSLDKQWQLTLELKLADLAQSIAGAQGNINARFNFSGDRTTPSLSAKLTGADLHWRDTALQQLTLDGELSLDRDYRLSAALTVQAEHGYYQQHSIDQLMLTVNGSELQHQLALRVESAVHNANIELRGSLKRGQYWRATLLSAHLDSLLGAWLLTDSTELEYQFANTALTIQPHCWQQLPGRFCAQNPVTISSKQLALNVRLQQFALESLTPLLPDELALQGVIDAELSAQWQQGTLPQAQLSLSALNGVAQLQGTKAVTLPWVEGTLTAKLAQNTLSSTLAWQFADSASLQTTLSITDVQSDQRALQGKLQLQQFSLAFLQPLLQQDSALSGLLNSELDFSGDLTAPAINGELNLSKFSLSGKQAPLDVTDANITLMFAGQQATLAGQLTTDKGQVDLNGNAQWPQLNDWQLALNIKGDALRVQVPQATLQIAPDLTLTARPSLTAISGTVQVPVANISIDSLPQSAISLSDDLVLLDADLQPQADEAKTAFALQSDITVVLGRRVQLSAFGLQTRLGGRLRVRQQPKQAATIHGDVSLQDGTFRAYGQDLLIRQGKMSFNGPSDQPFLNVEAIRNPNNIEDGVVAGIRVTGPADEPVVTIFSEPAKPQANALAYLLMGRDIGSDSGSSSAALTTSLIGMSISSSSEVVGELGEAFGLRDLTLDTAGSGDNSQVTVSGYLSRDLQLKYGIGIFQPIGEFTLRYRLLNNLYLEAVSGVDKAADLLYKFEF